MIDPPAFESRRQVGVAAVVALITVVAVAFLVLGGGGGDAGPAAGDGDPDGEVTPTGAPDVDAEDAPPGMNGTTLLDDDELVSAHRAAMGESGFAYRFEYRRTNNRSSGKGIDVSGEVRASAGLSPVEERIDRRKPTEEQVVTWTNGTEGARRTVANGTTYEEYPYSFGPRVTLYHAVANHVSFGEWDVSDVRETDDGCRFVLVAADLDRVGAAIDWHDELLNYSGRMVVDEEGRIRRFRANFTTTEPVGDETDRRQRITRTLVYEVTTVGNVTVPSPEWLDEVGRLVADDRRRE